MKILNRRKLSNVLAVVIGVIAILVIYLVVKTKSIDEDKEVGQNPIESNGEAGQEIDNEEATKIAFSTNNNYRSYLYIDVSLPEGVAPSDITGINFLIDTAEELSIRLYAGEGAISKSEDNELTWENRELKTTVEAVEKVTLEEAQVEKTTHILTDEILSTTRIHVTEGERQQVKYITDDRGKAIFTNMNGNTLTFLVYAHNIAPSFFLHGLQISTADGVHEISLMEENIGGLEGGSVKITR